jgi:hypothetical protein
MSYLKIPFVLIFIFLILSNCAPQESQGKVMDLVPIALLGSPTDSQKPIPDEKLSTSETATPLVVPPDGVVALRPSSASNPSGNPSIGSSSASGNSSDSSNASPGGSSGNNSVLDSNTNTDTRFSFSAFLPGKLNEGDPAFKTQDIFQNLVFFFASNMDRQSVEENLQILGSDGKKILFDFYWVNSKKLVIDPLLELEENSIYTLLLNGATLEDESPYAGFQVQMKTGSSYAMTHKINGLIPFQTKANGGVVLDKSLHPSVTLESSFVKNPPFGAVKSVRLYKLGYSASIPVEVVNGNYVTKFEPSAASDTLYKAQEGANIYYYCINLDEPNDGAKPCNLIRTVSYYYGNPAKNPTTNLPDPNSIVSKSVKATIDQATFDTMGKLLQRYGTEAFTLKQMSLNGIMNEKISRDLNKPMLDPKGHTCRDMKMNGNSPSANVKIDYLKRVGPFCDISASGTTTLTMAAVKEILADLLGITNVGEQCKPWSWSLIVNALPCGALAGAGLISDNTEVLELDYTSKLDVYITGMRISTPNDKPPAPADNLKLALSAEKDSLNINLASRTATGGMAMVIEMTGATQTGKGLLAFIQNIPAPDFLGKGKFQFNTPFVLNGQKVIFQTGLADTNDPKFPLNSEYRNASIKTTASVDKDGNILVKVKDPKVSGNLEVKEWAERLAVQPINKDPDAYTLSSTGFVKFLDGLVFPVLRVIVKQAIQEQMVDMSPDAVTPGVVKSTVGDVAERVTPDLLNTLLSRVKSGFELNLPDYLPEPIASMALSIKALPQAATPNRDGAYNALETDMGASITACVGTIDPKTKVCNHKVGHPIPPTVQGSNSFISLRRYDLTGKPAELPIQIKDANKIYKGTLISVHGDAANQALFNLWRAGAFNLKIDNEILNLTKQLVTQMGKSDDLLRFAESLLNGGAITTVFDAGKPTWYSVDATKGTKILINEKDVVYAELDPQIYPLAYPYLDRNGTDYQKPQLKIMFPDLIVQLKGASVGSNGKPDGARDYLMGKLKINLSMLVKFDIVKKETKHITIKLPSGNVQKFSSNQFMQVIVPKVTNDTEALAAGLSYSLEVMLGKENNPLGLNPVRIEATMKPLVYSLVLPLVNSILGEIPIPHMNVCGLQLDELEVLPIQKTVLDPYLFIRAKLDQYKNLETNQVELFTGDCSLDTILPK